MVSGASLHVFYSHCKDYSGCSLGIGDRRSENSLFTTQNSPANVRQPMSILYSDVEPLSQYSPIKLQLSPATRFLSEKPVISSLQ